jgi:hypothetical protein
LSENTTASVRSGNRSYASTGYIATGARDVTRKVYYFFPSESTEENKGPIYTGDKTWQEWTNQSEVEGSELLDQVEGVSFDNLENLSAQNYKFEYYKEDIVVSETNSGDVEVTSTLTLTGTEAVERSTVESYVQTVEKQSDVLLNYSVNTKNVSGLYITESSSEIDVSEYTTNPLYLENKPVGEYSVEYVRLVPDNETENDVNPNSDDPILSTNSQRDISQLLKQNEGTKSVFPNDSTKQFIRIQ